MDASICRQNIRMILTREERLLNAMLEVRSLIKGGFYQTKLTCGKKGCKCERGELHEVWMFYRSENGKRITRTMTRQEVSAYKQYTNSYKKYRQGRTELVNLYKEQLRLIDLLEKELRKDKRNIEQKLLRKRR